MAITGITSDASTAYFALVYKYISLVIPIVNPLTYALHGTRVLTIAQFEKRFRRFHIFYGFFESGPP